MLLKYTVIFFVVVGVQSATFHRRNIPVEVRYERYDHDITSNLAEKVQLSEEELKENQLRLQKLSIAEENSVVPVKDHSNAIKNLNEKVQLSPEELLQSSKHIPIHHSLQETSEDGDLNKLGELRSEPFPATTTADAENKASLIQQAQDIIEKGLKNLRKNFMPLENQAAPSKELWEKLEKDVMEYFLEEKNKLGSRQDSGSNQQNFFQNIANGFQQISNNFIQQFQGQLQTSQNGTSGDEGTTQQQGPIQGFIGYFTGGVQNIVTNIQSIGQSSQQAPADSTVLGDSGSSAQPGNFIGNFVNGVQQFFQAPQQGINQILSANSTQGDTGSSNPPAQQGFIAGAISQFNQVVGNIIPTSQAPPAAQGDEGTSSSGAASQGPIQQVFQSFGNLGTAFNQFIQGGQQNKPQGSEEESSSQPPNQNFIQSVGQNIGNAFQNIQNQFRPGGTTAKPAEGGSSGSSNPIVGQVSNIGNQIQQAASQAVSISPIQNLIPGGSAGSPAKQPADEQPVASEPAPVEEKTESPGTTPAADLEKKEVMTATE